MTPDNSLPTSAKVTIHAHQPKAISPDLFGIFFEDLNYAADGGLYPELIQNRSFEYSSVDYNDWNFFTAWELIQEGGQCAITLETAAPLHPNNPHYVVLDIPNAGGRVGLRNYGFDGIVLNAGEDYTVSLFARAIAGDIEALTVHLEGRTGAMLGKATFDGLTGDWAKYSATIQAADDERFARFVLLVEGSGALALDMISLFPVKTFHDRANGLRPDLAQVIADLKPKFVRFPGGCLVHGDGLDNMYRWQDTIGPVETRREQPNIWSYHQTAGLGYYEYFQFCEDIGAKPVPVVPAGVCCQNTEAKFTGLWGLGQRGLPLEAMPDYVQEVLDLIEWANGPVTSPWGAKRAEAGHPEPFGLEYLGVGNEDHITPGFKERFKLIYDAVKAKHPEIIVIGTVGPFTEGEDYEEGWKFARELNLEWVDEHGYRDPAWFWENLSRFDSYDRADATVYLGEYAAHDIGRMNTLRSALAEAAYMTALERNGDIVRFASYAPLLGKHRHLNWEPDLIYFDNVAINLSINYYVQQLFSLNAGDTYLPVTIDFDDAGKTLAVSCVQDTASGAVIVKLVNRNEAALRVKIDLSAFAAIEPAATCTVMTGDPLDENAFGRPLKVMPETSNITAARRFDYDVPACALSIIRLMAR